LVPLVAEHRLPGPLRIRPGPVSPAVRAGVPRSTSRRRGRLVVLHLSVLEGRLDRSRRGLSLRAALELRPGELSSLRGDLDKANRLHRSEEHTSELQSRENLVCRLLLENK